MKFAGSAKLQPSLRVPAGNPESAMCFGQVVPMSSTVLIAPPAVLVVNPSRGGAAWTA
jgi:hypothetical protein